MVYRRGKIYKILDVHYIVCSFYCLRPKSTAIGPVDVHHMASLLFCLNFHDKFKPMGVKHRLAIKKQGTKIPLIRS